MSTRVYLSKNPCPTTQEEKTPVCIRIQASHATVKALQARLQDAYRRDDVRLVRRISVRSCTSIVRGIPSPENQVQCPHITTV